MKFVNRGFIQVTPKKAFIDWANQHDEDFTDLTDNEPSIYLVEDDFFDNDPVLLAHFKKIFKNELKAVCADEELFPPLTIEEFHNWFDVTLGTSVFDTQKSNLIAD